MFIAFVIFKIVFCVFQNLVYGYNTLGNKIDALNLRNREERPSFQKLRLALRGFLKYFAAMEEVVPPQTMCFPSFEKNSDIILFASSLFEGGRKEG